MLARWAAQKAVGSLFRGNNISLGARQVIYRPTKLGSPLVSFTTRHFSTSLVLSSDAHKTYFQPGDTQYARSVAGDRAPAATSIPSISTPTAATTTNFPEWARFFQFGPMWFKMVIQILGWITLLPFIVTFIVLLNDYVTNGYDSVKNRLAMAKLSSKHEAAASGTHELFSLMLLHIMDSNTLYDAYRDDELLELNPLVLHDGTRVTAQNGGVVIRIVDAGGRTRMLILALEAAESRLRAAVRKRGGTHVSNSSDIDKWLLALSNKIYRENNEGEVGLTLMYFTRDEMGIGPVGGDEDMALMQCFPYDATAEDSYGSMFEVLREVKQTRRELPKVEVTSEESEEESEDRLESLQQSLGEVIEEIEP